jgi:hypothetical protein
MTSTGTLTEVHLCCRYSSSCQKALASRPWKKEHRQSFRSRVVPWYGKSSYRRAGPGGSGGGHARARTPHTHSERNARPARQPEPAPRTHTRPSRPHHRKQQHDHAEAPHARAPPAPPEYGERARKVALAPAAVP